MRKKQIHMLGIILILAVSMANRALADGTLQYWGEMISDGGGKKGDLCSLIGGLGGAPHRYGRYSLYEFDPEDAILTEENVQVYRGGGCTVFFDLHLNQDAVNALLEDQLAVQLEVCRVGESCTFQDVAVLALDEPVDTVLDKLWAVVVAQGNDDLQSQIDTHVTAGLTKRDRDFLIMKLKEIDSGPEMEMDVECPDCGKKFKAALDMADFFGG